MKNKIKIIVAMSGGVDSSVAAALLKRAGFDVVGVFMKFWRPPLCGGTRIYADINADLLGYENRCCSVESEKLARLVAKKIGIPFYVINVEKEFKKKVVDYFLEEYKKGNTPNPCVVCNKEIKFGLLIKKALKLGADFVATGHYANTTLSMRSSLQSHRMPIKLLKGDKEKDQSYFLWQLNQGQLDRVLFPVGNYTKPEVRKLAKKFKLPTAETPESQEVCFISGTINEFLKKYLKTKPGNIVDKSGKVLGEHEGLYFYTIGQRKGIGLGGSASAKGFGETKPYYVVAKDFKKNNLIISKDKKDLLQKELIAKNINWILPQKLPLNCQVKIRYRSNLADARIIYTLIRSNKGVSADKVNVVFKKPQKAITPGQSAVFYKGNQLLGGGVIE